MERVAVHLRRAVGHFGNVADLYQPSVPDIQHDARHISRRGQELPTNHSDDTVRRRISTGLEAHVGGPEPLYHRARIDPQLRHPLCRQLDPNLSRLAARYLHVAYVRHGF